MKKQFMRVANTVIASKFLRTSLLILITVNSQKGLAQTAHHAEINQKPAVITHLETNDENMIFRLNFDNPSGEKFLVIVKDNDGVLFQNAYWGKNFDKKFLLPKPEDNRVTFIIRNTKTNWSEAFEVNRNTRTIEEIIVKRVD